MNILIVIAAWLAYFTLHSFFASLKVKALVKLKRYRLFYSIIAVFSLAPVLLIQLIFRGEVMLEKSVGLQAFSLISGAMSLWLVRKPFKYLSFSAFLGLSEEEDKGLITEGIYSHIRHPIYSAALLFALGFWAWSPNEGNLGMLIAWIIYIPFGIYFEEKRLISTFGEEYRNYKKRVPSLVPGLPV